jgi:hypothetical protein
VLDKYDDLYLRAFSEIEQAEPLGRLRIMTEQLMEAQQRSGIPIPETSRPATVDETPVMSVELRAAEVMISATSLPDELF